jgi:hypothetical protein
METDLSSVVSIQWTATFVPDIETTARKNHARPSSALRLRGVVEGRAWDFAGRLAAPEWAASLQPGYLLPVLKVQDRNASGLPARSRTEEVAMV